MANIFENVIDACGVLIVLTPSLCQDKDRRSLLKAALNVHIDNNLFSIQIIKVWNVCVCVGEGVGGLGGGEAHLCASLRVCLCGAAKIENVFVQKL